MRLALTQLDVRPRCAEANRELTRGIDEVRGDIVVLPELAASGYGLMTHEEVAAAERIPEPALSLGSGCVIDP